MAVRDLLADYPEQSPRATAYLERVERGEIEVFTSDTVVFEVALDPGAVLSKAQAGDQRRGRALSSELPGINLTGKRRYRRAFDLYVRHNLPFADAYHVAVMESLGVLEVISFDRHFDRMPGITRSES